MLKFKATPLELITNRVSVYIDQNHGDADIRTKYIYSFDTISDCLMSEIYLKLSAFIELQEELNNVLKDVQSYGADLKLQLAKFSLKDSKRNQLLNSFNKNFNNIISDDENLEEWFDYFGFCSDRYYDTSDNRALARINKIIYYNNLGVPFKIEREY